MDNLRPLVYEDKTNLDAFNINETDSLNNLIYDGWLLGRAEIDPFESNHLVCYLKVFNDAYYICTLALLLPKGSNLIPSRTNLMVEIPSVVFPIVHLYLSRLTNKTKGIMRFLTQIGTAFQRTPDWQQNFHELQEAVSKNGESIDPNIFAQRKYTSELLSKINWCKVTNNFEKEKITTIVRSFARNKEAWNLMCEAIKAAAQKYDYDFGFEDYEYEGIDEDGPYTKIVKVPRETYDLAGNDISEPMKRAGVYEFCDELKEKYKELVLASQPMEDKSDSTKTKYQLIDITLSDMSTDIDKKKRISQLPDVLNTEIARSIFSKCIEKGWIEETETGYSWKGLKNCSGRIAQLSYLCGKIYGFKYDKVSKNIGSEFPDEALCKLFNEKYLENQLVQVYSAAKPQKWRAVLDELFV